MINTFICSRSCLENHTPFQTKNYRQNVCTCFQTKKAQRPYPLGLHILHGLYKGVRASWAIAYIVYLQKFDTSHNFETNHNNCLLLKKKIKIKNFTQWACSMCHNPAANIIDTISSSISFVAVFSSSSIMLDHLNLPQNRQNKLLVTLVNPIKYQILNQTYNISSRK